MTDPMGHMSNTAYDSYGNVATSTDPLSRPTKTLYSARGLLLQSTDPTSAVTSQTYYPDGDEHTQTNALYRTSTTTIDSRGLTTASTDFLSNVTTDLYLCSWQPQPVRIFRIFSSTRTGGVSLRRARGAGPFGEARERVRAGGAMGESGGDVVTRPAPARVFSSAAWGEPGRFPGRRHNRHSRWRRSCERRRPAPVPAAASLPRGAPGPAAWRCAS